MDAVDVDSFKLSKEMLEEDEVFVDGVFRKIGKAKSGVRNVYPCDFWMQRISQAHGFRWSDQPMIVDG